MLHFYGHALSSQSDQMIELSDLAISASPKALQAIGKFLQQLAHEIELGRLSNSHIHIESRIPNWQELGNGIDIQVMNINYPGPKICVDTEEDSHKGSY